MESQTAARQAALNGNEPSDALRVVNAVLTQLYQLQARINVLLLTTSNLPAACDKAHQQLSQCSSSMQCVCVFSACMCVPKAARHCGQLN